MYFTAGLILLIVLWALIEQKQLMTTKYLIASTKLPKEFAKTSFLVLSDLHNHSFGKNNKRLLARIDELSPDFIIIAGDMINKREKCIPSNSYYLIENLVKKYKIYYALGNHEQYIDQIFMDEKLTIDENHSTWVEYEKKLNNLGVVFLDNESCIITKNHSKIRIVGVTVALEYYSKNKSNPLQSGYLESLLGKKEEDTFHILIAHNPIFFKEYVNWGADLTISGHLHGGLIRLPFLKGLLSPQIRFFPKYDAGRFTEGGKEMIVSRGLGSHSIMFRLFNPPELVFIKLKK